MGLRNILQPTNPQQTSNGTVLGGGILSLFEPGTTTFIQAFKDSGLVSPHTQPITLSGSGRADVWINQDCDLQLTDRNGNLILFQENANPDSLGAGAAGGLIANGSFETDTDGDGVPDSWVATDDAGSTNARDTTESTDGLASYRFTSSGTGGGTLTTENFFPVNDTEDLRVEFDMRSTVVGVRNIVRVEWYDVSQVSISDTDVYDSTVNPVTFVGFSLSATPPALARFAKLKLIGIDPSVALAGSTYFDKIASFYPTVVSGIFDNIEIVNNSIITTNTNGDLFLSPDGTGAVNITSADPVDLTDAKNALNVGSLTPSLSPHIAMDLNQIQAKADATNATDLGINLLGGDTDIGLSGSTITIGGVLEADEGIGTTDVLTATAGPRYILDDGGSTANNSRFDLTAVSDQLRLRLVDDADTGFGNIMLVDRTLNVVDLVTFGGNVQAPRLYLPELAAGADVANQGQVYVNASNELIYRSEGGVETNLLLGAGATTTVGTSQTMAAVASVGGVLPAGTKWFRIYIYGLNMDNNAESPNLRLSDGGGLQTTGYAWQRWTKDHTAAYSQTVQVSASAQTWWDVGTGLSNLGLVYGYYECQLIDTDTWSLYGKFRDDTAADETELEIFGQVTLDSEAVGFTVQSANASTWSGGTMNHISQT